MCATATWWVRTHILSACAVVYFTPRLGVHGLSESENITMDDLNAAGVGQVCAELRASLREYCALRSNSLNSLEGSIDTSEWW